MNLSKTDMPRTASICPNEYITNNAATENPVTFAQGNSFPENVSATQLTSHGKKSKWYTYNPINNAPPGTMYQKTSKILNLINVLSILLSATLIPPDKVKSALLEYHAILMVIACQQPLMKLGINDTAFQFISIKSRFLKIYMINKKKCDNCRIELDIGRDAIRVDQGVVGMKGFVPLEGILFFCCIKCLRDYFDMGDLKSLPPRIP